MTTRCGCQQPGTGSGQLAREGSRRTHQCTAPHQSAFDEAAHGCPPAHTVSGEHTQRHPGGQAAAAPAPARAAAQDGACAADLARRMGRDVAWPPGCLVAQGFPACRPQVSPRLRFHLRADIQQTLAARPTMSTAWTVRPAYALACHLPCAGPAHPPTRPSPPTHHEHRRVQLEVPPARLALKQRQPLRPRSPPARPPHPPTMSTGESSSAANRPLSSTRLPMPSTCVRRWRWGDRTGVHEGR